MNKENDCDRLIYIFNLGGYSAEPGISQTHYALGK